MVDYSPLWDTMQKRKITQYTLLKDKVLDNHTLDRLKKGQNITLVTLERICKYLSCTPNDVVSFTDDAMKKFCHFLWKVYVYAVNVNFLISKL